MRFILHRSSVKKLFFFFFFIKSNRCTATKIPFLYSFSGNCATSAQISTFMCLWAYYIFPGSVHIVSCYTIGRSIEWIYKSLTGTWMWKFELWPRYSFSGNICFEFSVLCLCSVGRDVIHCSFWEFEKSIFSVRSVKYINYIFVLLRSSDSCPYFIILQHNSLKYRPSILVNI